MHGVYLPFWTYDTNTTSYYTGERGEYYYVTETYYERDAQGNQVARTRQVRHTRWYSASGTVSRWFDERSRSRYNLARAKSSRSLRALGPGIVKAIRSSFSVGI